MNSEGVNGQATEGECLTIVIPALNEEASIGRTIAQCLDVRARVQEAAGLAAVEVIVVSDGSTDRTTQIAQSFDGVKVIVFERNRGYGAAIKEGWRQGRGTLLGFVDADGTCDPNYFANMCRTALDEEADIVLGSRLGHGSKMPWMRRVANRLYAMLLGILCGRQVTDTASGMRVVRRRSLKHLYPLPDGLHFTPAMSARALLNDLRVVEIPIRYEQRVGTSKLSMLGDGVRFLRAIFAGVLCYRPERLLLAMFVLCVLGIFLLGAYPLEFYWRHGRLEEWMIYRFVVCHLLGSFGLMLLLATALAHRISSLGPRRTAASTFWPHLTATLFRGTPLVVILGLLIASSLFFLWPGIVEYSATRKTALHWSRLLAGAFLLFSAVQVSVFSLLTTVVELWIRQKNE